MVKSYTSKEQSEMLIKLGIPIETADMWYQHIGYSITNGKEKPTYFLMVIRDNISDDDIPAWSLAALLDIIPYGIHKSDNEFYRLGIDKGYSDYAVWYSNNGLTINDLDVTSDNLVDACYEMIIKLHELKML